MEAGDLQRGFRLGQWLVEPQGMRISRDGESRVLPADHMRVLLCLAAQHGEAVDHATLADRGWPGDPAASERLTAALASLQEVFGDVPQHPRYLVPVGDDASALIAHLETLPATSGPATETMTGAGADAPAPRTWIQRVSDLVAELRRRQVFKVTASYLVAMWIVLQVAEVTFAPLHLPPWWISALTILAILGLPIVVVLAWTYEITPGGIVVDTGGALVGMKLPRARRAVAPVIVTGVAAMAAVTGFAWWRSIQVSETANELPPEPGAPSVAVLPLVDMSPAGGSRFLGDGLSEELSMRLAQVPGLRVASRTSAFEFRNRSMDVRHIGQALGVRHVLEGSVRREGDNLRVTVQLIDARTGYHVWAGSYDRGWRDVLALQDEVARSVTDALKGVLTPAAQGPAERRKSLDTRAIEPYLAGLALLRRSADLSALNEARARFDEAVALAPEFAPAHAGLCETIAARYRRTHDPDDLASAEGACTRALQLDSSLIETERALGALYVAGGRYADAEPVYRRVIARDPDNTDGYIGLARAYEGRGELGSAEAAYRRAAAVEPAYWGTHRALGAFLFAQGRFDAAAVEFRRVTELTPFSASAYNNLAAALLMSGNLDGAIEASQKSLSLEPSQSAYSNLATSYYYRGRMAEAADNYRRATQLAPQDPTLWGNLADAEWRIPGQRDAAVANYRRAVSLGERDLSLSAGDAQLRAQLGYYYGRTGDEARSEAYLQEALASGAQVMYVQYFAALAAADRGDTAAAVEAAERAAQLGYRRVLLRADPALADVRQLLRRE